MASPAAYREDWASPDQVLRRKEQALRQALNRDVRRFDTEATKHKLIYRSCALVVIVLSTMTTITASLGLLLDQRYGRTIQFTVVALTAITTAVSGWMEMRRARELWRHEREVGYALRDILRDLDYRSATGEFNDHYLDQCFERAREIIGTSSVNWKMIHSSIPADQTLSRIPPSKSDADAGKS